MDDKQTKELIAAINRIADELEELNKNISYLPVHNGMIVKETRKAYEYGPTADYYEYGGE